MAAKGKPKQYEYQPVGLDAWDPRPFHPAPGTRVVKTQPPGTPRNGTMGHTYVANAETGEFHGLVLQNSLQPLFNDRRKTAPKKGKS